MIGSSCLRVPGFHPPHRQDDAADDYQEFLFYSRINIGVWLIGLPLLLLIPIICQIVG